MRKMHLSNIYDKIHIKQDLYTLVLINLIVLFLYSINA